MRRPTLPASLLIAAALFAACAPRPPRAAAPPPGPTPRAVVVIWDGAKPAVLGPLLEAGGLPSLRALMDEGAWTLRARTTVPSLTLPTHTSMLTGVGPLAHGVTWNSYRPERGVVAVPTVFEVAGASGKRTAFVCGKEKFRHLAKEGAPGRFVLVDGEAAQATAEAVGLLKTFRPDLLVLHLRPADDAGHEWGWGSLSEGVPPSPQYLAALGACDAATGTLVAALREAGWGSTLLIVTADHGGSHDNHGSAADEDVLIPWVAAGGLVAARGELAVPVVTMDTSATALEALGVAVPGGWEGRPVPVLAARTTKKAA